MKSISVLECLLMVLSVSAALPIDQGNPNQVLGFPQSPPPSQQTNDGPFVRVFELSEWNPVPDGVSQNPPQATNFLRPVEVQHTPTAVVVPPVQPRGRYYVLINGKPYHYDPYLYYGLG